MDLKKKKIAILVLIIVITFVVLSMGFTYAYLGMSFSIDGNTTTVEANFESVGVVSLSAGPTLKLNISEVQMMQQTGDVEFYATESGVPVTSLNTAPIATASAEGNGTMSCNYSLGVSVSGTNNMYTAFTNMTSKSVGQLVLTVDGVDYDFNEITFPKTIAGTITGLKEDSPQDIMASFKVVNKSSIDQSDLAGTDLTITFTVENISCSIVD